MLSIKYRFKLLLLAVLMLSLTGPAFAANTATTVPNTTQYANINDLINRSGINPDALKMGLDAYLYAVAKGRAHKKLLTIIDFSLPSNTKRLWVIDLSTDRVLMNTYVAHGSGSGGIYATHFSNQPNSHESSLGAFVTGGVYTGKFGYSLRINGLEKGINNNVSERHIIVHPYQTVTRQYVQKYDQVGRTWGCFGLSPKVSQQVIDWIKGGSVIFAYAGQENQDPYLTPLNSFV